MIKKIISQPVLIKTFFWISLVLLVAIFTEYSRLGLPEMKGPGHKDDQSIALIVMGILLLFSATHIVVARMGITLVLVTLFVITLSNWWFYDFYRDFLTVETVKLAAFAKETVLSWDGLKFKAEAAQLLISMIVLGFIFQSFNHSKPRALTLIIVGLVTLGLGVQQQVEYLDRTIGGLKHRGINHIGYFARSFIPKKDVVLTKEMFEQLKRALPEKNLTSASVQFPLFQDSQKSQNPENKRNVIILVMESVRSAETGLANAEAKSITPNLDKFASQSVSYRNFYANSNQTVRGEVAILCSALDYINGAPYSMAGDKLPTNCLPSILAKEGYSTHWIHGYEKEFYNRQNFYPTLGFQHIHDQAIIDPDNNKAKIGWGLSDPVLFEYALDELEHLEEPFFAEILTLSNHYPYLWDWGIEFPENLRLQKELVEDVDNIYPAYKRGIYYTDYAVGLFLNRFQDSPLSENTLLIITGDHGIWTFPDGLLKKGSIEAELRKNEIYFRLPLLISAPDLEPNQVEMPASQADLAPTILDYLGISAPNTFLGHSLFDRSEDGDYPVYFMAAGSYGVRREGQYCYPVDTSGTCDTHYRDCRSSVKVENSTICVETEDDLLDASAKLSFVEIDNTRDKTLIDLTQYFLRHEYMPAEKLY